jgi:type I restriction enzyme S subunit
MSEWKEYTLGNISSMRYGKMPNKELISDSGYPIFTGYQVVGFYPEYNCEEKQIVIVARGVGGTGDVKLSPPKCYVTNLSIIVELDTNIVDKKYFYYKYQKRNLKYLDSGSAQSQITIDSLRSLSVYLPELSKQKKIVGILSVVDYKIDLLRRQNETLEAIAQTLFKRWFVKFEFPDENGRPYKSSGGKMVSLELGEIPEGWRVGKIGNICSILNEVISPNTKEKKLYFHYSIPAFDDGCFPKKEYGKNILSNKFCIKSNTILVSKLNPRKPRIWPIFEIDEKKSISSTEFQVIKPIEKSYYCFIFSMFKSRYVRKEMAQRATGTSGSHQRIRPDDILDIDIVISRENLILDFGNVAKKMIEKIDSNLKTIQTLSQTREILLPKLMSGQIRVK